MKTGRRNFKALTLVEVVITLVVIGVVSAITIPMLHNDVNDKKWNVARQKAQATIGEAFKLATVNGEISIKTPYGDDMTSEYFVTKILAKYLKLEKTCTNTNYEKCGFPKKVKTAKGTYVSGVEPKDYKWTTLSEGKVWNSGTSITSFNGKYGVNAAHNASYFFRTLDGFSVSFLINPYCVSDTSEHYTDTVSIGDSTYYRQYSLDLICLMGIYDMNGQKGPNKVGMDIGFVGSFYNGFITQSAAVLPHSDEKFYNNVPNASTPWNRLNNYCNNLEKNNTWVIPNINELMLIYLNYKLVSNATSAGDKWFTSRTMMGNSGYFWDVGFLGYSGGNRHWSLPTRGDSNGLGPYVRCVRNTALK